MVLQARARREVTVCGGAVNSPQLLQLSGVGPAAHLQSIGIPVAHDLAGVGSNLIDHLAALLAYRARGDCEPAAAWCELRREVARWCLFGTGALTLCVSTASVFARSAEGRISPDLHPLHACELRPQSLWRTRTRAWHDRGRLCGEPGESRNDHGGFADLKVRPRDPAELFLRTCGHGGDAGWRPVRPPYFAQPAIADVVASETVPGLEAQDDQALTEFARLHTSTVFHPVGTCRMGSILSQSSIRACACMGSRACGWSMPGHAEDHDWQHQCPDHHDR